VGETSACGVAIVRLLEDRALADGLGAIRREPVREQFWLPRLMRAARRVLVQLAAAPLAAMCAQASL
jgi:hypothetical protein